MRKGRNAVYDIYAMLDGTFRCHGRIQDGTERWQSPTMEEAVKSMKTHAKVMNGTKIKRKDIRFWKEAVVQESKFVPMEVPRK
jgi:hypothetical protein